MDASKHLKEIHAILLESSHTPHEALLLIAKTFTARGIDALAAAPEDAAPTCSKHGEYRGDWCPVCGEKQVANDGLPSEITVTTTTGNVTYYRRANAALREQALEEGRKQAVRWLLYVGGVGHETLADILCGDTGAANDDIDVNAEFADVQKAAALRTKRETR